MDTHLYKVLTFINAVDSVDEPWQHVKARHGQYEERRYSGSSNGTQVPSSEEELLSISGFFVTRRGYN